MIYTSDILTDIFQRKFGAKYEVHSQHAFNQRFTNATLTPYGTYNIEYQSFEQHADKIIAVVAVQPLAQNFTPYEALSANFSIQFWVPLNHIKQAEDGELIEAVKFDFKGDFANVEKDIKGQEIEVEGENGEQLRCFITLSEPIVSSGKEISGAYDRVVYTAAGTATVCASYVNVGKDTVIKFVFDADEKEVALEQYRTFAIGSTMDANAVQDSGQLDAKQEQAVKSRQMTFYVDDVRTDNRAFVLIKRRAFENLEIINDYLAESDIDKARQVHVRVYQRGALLTDFWGNISSQYTTNGDNGFGSYQVAIVDSGG